MPIRMLFATAALALALVPLAAAREGDSTRTGVFIPADSITADSLRPAETRLLATPRGRGKAPGAPAPAGAAPAESVAAAMPPAAPSARDYLAEARASYTPVNRAYQDTRVVLRFVGPLYGAIVTLLLLFTGLSARFRDIAHALGHRLYVRVLVYFTLFATASAILGLPLAWYEEYALEHQYGLSNQTLSGWFTDSGKGLLFLIVALGVVPLLYTAWSVVRAHPRGWWWRLGAGAGPLAVAVTVLQPLVLEPVFNRFEPLRDESLRGEILGLGDRAGIPAKHVFQVDMSRRTKKINAYVSGFGGSQRIVLWDTMLESMKRDEILAVMGHEIGHYVLGHIWKSLVVLALGAFVMLWLAERFTAWLVAAFGRSWGADGVGDLAALPALSLALTLVTLLAQPGLNAHSRAVEHESDVYALEITRDNDAAARAFLKLAQDNRQNPEPAGWVKVLLYGHPPLGERIRFALAYRPWEEGRPNRFFHER